MTGGEALEVQPPDFNRLKCKPVSSAVRKQIEIFVPLVPYRARRFSWTRFRTVDTLDAEQDPRRRHEPDTVFFVCGFNTMGEFSVVSVFLFFLFSFFFFFASCQGCKRAVQRQGGEKHSEILSVGDVLAGRFSCKSSGEEASRLNHSMCQFTHEFWQ